jgi:hypothetical protein
MLRAALSCNRDRASLIAFYISTGARASELLGVRQGLVVPEEQLIGVIRKGSRALQRLPASTDAVDLSSTGSFILCVRSHHRHQLVIIKPTRGWQSLNMTMMSDLARLGDMTTATVSNVINNKGIIGAATLQFVLTIIKELG